MNLVINTYSNPNMQSTTKQYFFSFKPKIKCCQILFWANLFNTTACGLNIESECN